MRPKRTLWIIGGIVVVVAILCVVASLLQRGALSSLEQFATPTVEGTAAPAEIAVRARGKVVPATWAELAFTDTGAVAAWEVAEGDPVKAGDVLGQLDTSEAALALDEAEVALAIAEARLAQAENERAPRIAEAELALQLAEQRLEQARMRVPALTAAYVRLEAAREAEAFAQDEYNKSLDRHWEPDQLRDSYHNALQNAIDTRQIAEADYAAAGADRAAAAQELEILQSEVQRAQLALDEARQAVDPVLAQEVARARVLVDQAQARLDAATLVAPFDGTVVTLHLKAGDWAQPGVPAVTLADLDHLQVETTDLDEWGAAQIAVGDEATITFTAFDDKTLTGHVTEIALRGDELTTGDMTYRTLIALDESDPALRWGMTVRLSLPLEAQ